MVHKTPIENRRAFEFEGENTERVEVPINGGYTADSPLTLSIWASPTKYPSSGNVTGLFSIQSEIELGIDWHWKGPDRVRFGLDGGPRISSDDGVLPVGRLVHIVGVFEPTDSGSLEARLYVNGNLVGTETAAQVVGTASNLHIGGGQIVSGSPAHFSGIVDDARVYDLALSDSDIQDLNKGVHIEADPIGHWTLDDISGGTTTDVSGNENHGTIFGEPELVTSISPTRADQGPSEAGAELINHLPPWMATDPSKGNFKLIDVVGHAVDSLDEDAERVENATLVQTAESIDQLRHLAEMVNLSPRDEEGVETFRTRTIAEYQKLTSEGTIKNILDNSASILDLDIDRLGYTKLSENGVGQLTVPKKALDRSDLSGTDFKSVITSQAAAGFRIEITTTGTFTYITATDYSNGNHTASEGYTNLDADGNPTDNGGTYAGAI